MKTLTFSSIKGGVGKSSCAIMTADFLSSVGKKVLFIDLDIQNASTFYYCEDPDLIEEAHAARLLFEGDIRKNITPTHKENIDLIASSLSLVKLRASSPESLKRLLPDIQDEYDFCIIDTAPTWDNITLAGFIAADMVITPIELTQWDYKGALFYRDQITLDMGLEALDKWNLLINSYKKPRSENPELIKNAILDLFEQVFDNIIPVKIPERALVQAHIDTREPITTAKDKVLLLTAIEELVFLVTKERLVGEKF